MYTSSILKKRQENIPNSKSLIDYPTKDVCVQKTITNLRITADLDEVAFLLESGQGEKLSLRNSVEQHCSSEAISVQLSRSKTARKPGQNGRGLSNGNYVKSSTCSIEQVSRSLDEVMASGKAFLERLALKNSKKVDPEHNGDAASSDKQTDMNSEASLNRRGTYDLGKVADIMDCGVAKGMSHEDSLDDVSQRLNGHVQESGTSRIQRNTFDLNDVSVKLDESQHSEMSLDELLQDLACEEEGLITSDAPSKVKRGTYDLDRVSSTLDDSLSSGKTLEDSLEQISVGETEDYRPSIQDKHRTYDLSDVSNKLDQSINNSSFLDDSLDIAADIGCDQVDSEKRQTYELSNISDELDRSVNSGTSLQDSLEQISKTNLEDSCSAEIKRRTYDLTDIEINYQPTQQDHLDKLSCNNNTIQLDRPGLPASTTPQNGKCITAASKCDNVPEKQNTYTLDNVASEINAGLSNGTNIQESYKALSKNLSQQNGIHSASVEKPLESILLELRLSTEDSRNKANELTPGQWIEQMKGLKKSPKVSLKKVRNGSPSKITNDQRKLDSSGSSLKNGKQPVGAKFRSNSEKSKLAPKGHTDAGSRSSPRSSSSSRSNSERSSSSSSGEKSRSTPRSRSLSGSTSSSELSSRSTSDMRSRSLSDSKSCSALKSSSTPDFSLRSESSLEKDSLPLESLKDISPGIRNYLTNKLGLSEEQCLEVHRRLSGSETPIQTSSLEHRKTYSLDDVAHSLDIATSQGLPMTKVLDDLDVDNENVLTDGNGGPEKSQQTDEVTKQHHKSSLSTQEDQGTSSAVEKPNSSGSTSTGQNSSRKSESRVITLQSNAFQSKSSLNQRTYTLNNGNNSVDGKTSNKVSTTSLDSLCQFKLNTKKAVYKPSAKLHSFSHLLGERSVQNRLRNGRAGVNESKRNTYTLESVAETLEKAQDAGVAMNDALKRLSGSCKGDQSELSSEENRKTYSLDDVSKTLENATECGVAIVDTLHKIAEPDETRRNSESETPAQSTTKKKAPPKPKRTFSKPEIKFESNSFVIEHYTSPKKSQSTSSEQDICDGDVQENVKRAFDGACKVNGEGIFTDSELKRSSSDKAGSSLVVKSNNLDKKGPKPTAKVVNDLDSLLVMLAAEVDKSKENMDSTGSERDSCSTRSSSDISEKLGELVSKTVEPTGDNQSVKGSEMSKDCKEISSDVSSLPMKPESCDVPIEDSVFIHDETNKEFGEESASIPTPALPQQVEIGTVDISDGKNVVLNETGNHCVDNEIESKEPFVPVHDRDSNVRTVDEEDCLFSSKPETNSKNDNELDGVDVHVLGEELEIVDLEERSIEVENTATKVESVHVYENCDQIQECVINSCPAKEGTSIQLSGSEGAVKSCRTAEDGTQLCNSEDNVKSCPAEEDTNIQLCNSEDNEDTNTQLCGLEVDVSSKSEPIEGFGQPGDKSEGVSRELNLLRLKLAEKQRDIEAQKQRTKEQLEEERKRVGQNVFWFAVGKGREKKETNGVKLSKESRDEKHIEPPLSNISKKTLHSSEVESSEDKKFITFTKQSSLDEELPPSMGKLQDRTYNLKPIDETLGGSNGNLTTDAEHGNLTTHAEHGKFTTGAEHGNLTTRAEHGKFTTGSEHGKITTGVEHSKITTGAEHGKITTGAEHSKITTGAEHSKLMTRTEPSVTTPSQSSPRREETSVLPVKLSVSDRNLSEEVVHEFRLSRQTSGSEDSVLNKVQTKPEVLGNSNGFLTESEKPRAPVMNYKSTISVPLTYTTKPASENFSDVDGFGNPVGVHADEDSNQASSPPRKCWDMDSVNQDEPQLAVSKSNYHIFEQNSDGAGDYKNNEKTCGNDVPAGWIDQHQRAYTRKVDGGVRNYVPDGSEALGRLDDEVYVKKPMISEKMLVDTKGSSPEGDPGRLEFNGNSPVSENDQDTPKKALALFIGQQNNVGEDGLTPEQSKKREKFLKSRLQKMEEEKIKKEAVLEKKRRKEEKMKEIQLRRDKEEHSRQTRLQEKKDQAEHAKQERQKYELQRKENATRSHFVDGVPSGYPGYTRTDMNPHAFTPETSDVSTFGMNGPVVVPASPASPSAFSGFTGVQSYVKPSGKTNRKLIINAISHVCLPGAVNKDTKDKCLQTMTESSAQHFLILFREGLKFRGLYSLDPESNQVLKVHGVGPRSITEKMIHRLYKYNSGGKEFSELPAKGFSLSVDGFTLQKSCWQSNKPSIASKTVSNYKQSSYRSTR